MGNKKYQLIKIDWPDFGEYKQPPNTEANELQDRINKAKTLMDKHNLSHLVVYGDREHFGNIAYLTGYDPRF